MAVRIVSTKGDVRTRTVAGKRKTTAPSKPSTGGGGGGGGIRVVAPSVGVKIVSTKGDVRTRTVAGKRIVIPPPKIPVKIEGIKVVRPTTITPLQKVAIVRRQQQAALARKAPVIIAPIRIVSTKGDVRTRTVAGKRRIIPIRKKLLPTIIPPIKKAVIRKKEITPDKEISKVLQLSINPKLDFFSKQQLKEEAGIRQKINNFSQERLSFYQRQINAKQINVATANKKLQEDINKRVNQEVGKSEFFKPEGATKRSPTLTRLGFIYETERLKATNKAQAGTLRFLSIAADTPQSFVNLGKAAFNLIRNPSSFVPLAAGIAASVTGPNLLIKGNQLKRFAFTRQGELIAEIAGTFLVFGVARSGLKLVGQLSKPASRSIVKSLKITPSLKRGLKGIPNISANVSKEVLKATGTITKIPSTKVSRSFGKALRETAPKTATAKQIKKTKKRIVELKKSLSGKEIKIRVKRRGLIGQAVTRIELRAATRKRKLLLKRTRKRGKAIIKRRAKLLKEKRKKEKQARFEKTKGFLASQKAKAILKKTAKEVIPKTETAKALKKIQKGLSKAKIKKERSRVKKLTKQRKEERLSRRKRLVREEKFNKSVIGKIVKKKNIQFSKAKRELKALKKLVEKFDNPDPLPKNIFRKLVREVRGIKKIDLTDIKKLTSTQKLALGRRRDNLEKRVKKQLAKIKKRRLNSQKILKQFRRNQKGVKLTKNLKKQQQNIRRKVFRTRQLSPIRKAALGKLKAKPIPPPKPPIVPKPRQVLLSPRATILKRRIESLSPQRKKQFVSRLNTIRKKIEARKFKINNQLLEQTKLTSIQQASLRIFNKRNIRLAKKEKAFAKQINIIKEQENRIQRSKIKPRAKQQQLLRLSKRESQALRRRKTVQRSLSASKVKTIQLLTLGLLNRQRLGTKQLQLQIQTGKLTQKQISALAQTQPQLLAQAQAQAQAQVLAQPQRAKLISPIIPVAKRRRFRGSRRKVRVRKKTTIKKQGFNVFARPLKKTKTAKKPKLIKINKVPLIKSKAKDLRNYIADTSLARTARIKQTRGSPRPPRVKVPSGFATRASKKFRRHRIVKGKRIPLSKGKVIERSKFLLDTRQEKRGITLRRRIKQLNKKIKLTKSKRR